MESEMHLLLHLCKVKMERQKGEYCKVRERTLGMNTNNGH